MYGLGPLGSSIKTGMATNAAIGVAANAAVQLSGNQSFNYVDSILAGVAGALTTGKGITASAAINMGSAALGSAVKGEDPTNAVIGAGAGSLMGSGVGKVVSGALGSSVKESTGEIIGAIGGSVASEKVGNTVKDVLDEKSTKK